jgi:transcriptional regulator with XRE-family HTH domain
MEPDMSAHKRATEYEVFKSSTAQRKLLRQEELILAFTEAISELLEKEGVSKSELAGRLGRSKGFVSQILSGNRNLTLRTISDVFDALGFVPQVEARREGHAKQRAHESLCLRWEEQPTYTYWPSWAQGLEPAAPCLEIPHRARSRRFTESPIGAA